MQADTASFPTGTFTTFKWKLYAHYIARMLFLTCINASTIKIKKTLFENIITIYENIIQY